MPGSGTPAGRWPARRDLLLPAVLVPGQLIVWPLVPLLIDRAVPAPDLAIGLTCTVLTGAVLGWRRTFPVAVWAATLVLRAVIAAAGLDLETALLWCADLAAIFAIARYRTARTIVGCLGVEAAALVPIDLLAGTRGFTLVANAVIGLALVGLVAAFGRARRHRGARREAVAARLARAEDDERYAAAAERERLAQELHDVAAHQLTAIVVHLGAAQRLAGRSPELVEQALGFAATAGRETVASLRRLVSLSGLPAAGDGPSLRAIADLVAGFTSLGLRVRYTVEGAPGMVPAEVEVAAYRIVQESLTNTLRHAGSAAVSVRIRHTPATVQVMVDDDGPDARGGSFTLGSGSGLRGMAMRAGQLGGAFDAGPRPDGGWSVRAALPLRAAELLGRPESAPAQLEPLWSAGPGHVRIFDAVLAAFVVLLPLGIGLETMTGPARSGAFADPRPGPVALVLLLVGLCGGSLLWRRRAPWLVLAATLLTVVQWSGLVMAGVLPWGSIEQLWLVSWAQFVAVYSVGAYARPAAVTWLSAPVAAIASAAVVAGFTARDPDVPAGQEAGFVIFNGVLVAGVLGVMLMPTWALGWRVARGRLRRLAQDLTALRIATSRAVEAARAERTRIAGGLRSVVLDHTERLVSTAAPQDAGRPDLDRVADTLSAGRAALAAMRELLTVLRVDTATAARAPQPTLAGVAALCRPAGVGAPLADLGVRGAPRPVPPEVELCSFRVVESVMPASGTGSDELPHVSIEYGHDDLRLVVSRLPAAPPATVLAAVRERVDAVGGALTTKPADGGGWTLRARFPIAEVTSSLPG